MKFPISSQSQLQKSIREVIDNWLGHQGIGETQAICSISTVHDEITVEFTVLTIVGRYYLHEERQHPVRVLSGRVLDEERDMWLYPVEDVVTGQIFNVKRPELGEELNEMEVIAWASV